MSSILKALRRLEEERSFRRDTPPEISTSILRGECRRNILPVWFWPVVVTFVMFVVAAVVVYGFVADNERRPQGSDPKVSMLSHDLSESELIIEEFFNTGMSETIPGRPAHPDLVTHQDGNKKHPRTVSDSFQSEKIKESAVRQSGVKQVSSEASSAENSFHSPESTDAKVTRDLTVSAIAWQEDRTLRMAVVNGLPVMEGEKIGPAQVLEIAQDHVEFIALGTIFKVNLQEL